MTMLRIFYIYEDEGENPAYRLYLDYNGGYVFPEMARLYFRE